MMFFYLGVLLSCVLVYFTFLRNKTYKNSLKNKKSLNVVITGGSKGF
jgi:hypothetical protein